MGDPSAASLADETVDVGADAHSPVTDDYDPWDNAFTGTITKIVVTLTRDDHLAGHVRRHVFRN